MVKATGLYKKFGDFTAVDNLSLDIYKGEILGFLGPNGAGKTTTISMICGLSPPTAGEVLIMGDRIKNNTEIKSRIGICPQENIHFNKLSCLEQLLFMGRMYGLARSEVKKRAEDLLKFMGLTRKRNVFAAKLSGGMKRRLNICLALIHDPKILVLDEPEAGLDPQSRILVRDFIKSLAKEKTVILTTHNMDEADRLSDRVAIIDHGQLLMLDSPEKLKRSIGDGDVLEIELEELITDEENLKKQLKGISKNVKVMDSMISIRAKNIIEKVNAITEKINKSGKKVYKMTYRENTLEDVFIHLTGRRLRQ